MVFIVLGVTQVMWIMIMLSYYFF